MYWGETVRGKIDIPLQGAELHSAGPSRSALVGAVMRFTSSAKVAFTGASCGPLPVERSRNAGRVASHYVIPAGGRSMARPNGPELRDTSVRTFSCDIAYSDSPAPSTGVLSTPIWQRTGQPVTATLVRRCRRGRLCRIPRPTPLAAGPSPSSLTCPVIHRVVSRRPHQLGGGFEFVAELFVDLRVDALERQDDWRRVIADVRQGFSPPPRLCQPRGRSGHDTTTGPELYHGVRSRLTTPSGLNTDVAYRLSHRAKTRFLPNESAVAFSEYWTSTPRVSVSSATESTAST